MTLYRIVVSYDIETDDPPSAVKQYLTDETAGIVVDSDLYILEAESTEDHVTFTYVSAEILSATVVNKK